MGSLSTVWDSHHPSTILGQNLGFLGLWCNTGDSHHPTSILGPILGSVSTNLGFPLSQPHFGVIEHYLGFLLSRRHLGAHFGVNEHYLGFPFSHLHFGAHFGIVERCLGFPLSQPHFRVTMRYLGSLCPTTIWGHILGSVSTIWGPSVPAPFRVTMRYLGFPLSHLHLGAHFGVNEHYLGSPLPPSPFRVSLWGPRAPPTPPAAPQPLYVSPPQAGSSPSSTARRPFGSGAATGAGRSRGSCRVCTTTG